VLLNFGGPGVEIEKEREREKKKIADVKSEMH
jgi:hypothetical protein